MKEIMRVNSPAEKKKLIDGLEKQIASSAQNFYQKNGVEVKKIELSPQDLNSILMFILVQANQPLLSAHFQITQLFWL